MQKRDKQSKLILMPLTSVTIGKMIVRALMRGSLNVQVNFFSILLVLQVFLPFSTKLQMWNKATTDGGLLHASASQGHP